MVDMAADFQDLPIRDYFSTIVESVDTNQVTIITAETGAGKSTQVPQYLASHGYAKVIVTQPRILAARNLSKRVREEWALRTLTDSEPIIGYRTAHERDDAPGTQILYCTDGLQLVREITGIGTTPRQVLILDEVHEWNENMEVLIAWAKKRCQEEPSFKVVIMSATIDTAPLARYFDTSAVIAVPGRSHPVTRRHGSTVLDELTKKMQSSTSNVLVFLPGKAEIQDVADAIAKKAAAANIPVIPLHSQLEATAQQQAFASYPNGKVILSTNIAQTSITIDDIDVVIDSGLERRSEVRSGVEGLFIATVSQADCLQRAGRAGRTKAGEYILAQYDTLPCPTLEERDPYGKPEILRKHIDRLTLRLANIGMDIEALDFYHDPSHKAIQQAKHTLTALGAMHSGTGITDIGRAMEKYPVESSYARMLVEAEASSSEIKSKLAVIIAIQEVGGIVKGGTRYTGWQQYTRQRTSDLLAQYDVFLSLSTILPEEYEELGIISKNIAKAQEVMERLSRDLQGITLDDSLLSPITAQEEQELIRCIVAGQINQLWSIDEHGDATHLFSHQVRELSSTSVVRHAPLVAGTPFDLEVPARDGSLQTLHLIQAVTKVDTELLLNLAPDSFTTTRGKMAFDPRSGMLVIRQQVRAGKRQFEGSSIPITKNTQQNQKLFQEAFAKWAYEQVEQERKALSGHYKRRIPSVALSHIKAKVRQHASNTINLESLPKNKRLQLLSLSKLATYIGADFVQQLATTTRTRTHPRKEQARRKWKPAHKRSSHRDRRNWD